MNILIKNCLVLPMTAMLSDDIKYFKGSVGISDGRITLVSDNSIDIDAFELKCGDDLNLVNGEGKLVMPGLINLHNHVSMSLMRSYADDMALMPWLTEKIWPFESKLIGEDVYLGAQLGIAEMLLGGTTTFADMYWFSDRVAQAALESGIRAVVCPTFVDSNMTTFMSEAERVIDLYNGAARGRIMVRLAPHSPYTCSADNLREAIKMARDHGIGLQVHLSETETEVKTIRERYNMTPTEFLDSLGLFDLPTLAAHCVHMTDSDIDIILSKGVTPVHNVQSNMKLASGVAPVAKMLNRGVNVCIGTDGPCSNNDLDMWDEMRSVSFLQKLSTGDPCLLPAYQVLQMATVNGAKAIGMEGELGIISEGAIADIIMLNLEKPHLSPSNDLIGNLIYSAKSTDVEMVIVDGEILVERGELLGVNVGQLCRDSSQRVTEINNRR